MIGKFPFAIALVLIWLVMTSRSASAMKKAGAVRFHIPTLASNTSLADLGGLAGCEGAVPAFPETGSGGTVGESRQPTMTMFLGATGLMVTSCVLLTRRRSG